LGEKPIFASALSLIGGILEIIIGINVVSWEKELLEQVLGGFGAAFGVWIGVYWIILGLIITIVAVMMCIRPSSTEFGGKIIIALSAISLVNIVAFIGGVFALIWE
jgi:hypothetical protein